MSDEQQIDALREEIRRAGEQTDVVRAKWFWCSIGLTVVLGIVITALGAFVPGLGLLLFFGALAAPVASVVALCAFPGAVVWRRGKELLLAHRLTRMPGAEMAAVLLPLRSDTNGDTRAIAKALIRGLDVPIEAAPPTELAPAPAPDARGDEASPMD